MNPLYISGITPTGELLAGGLFTMKDTHGMPLDLSYELCKENKLCPDWLEYLLDAGRQDGWKWDSAADEMRLLVGDTIAKELIEKYKVYCALNTRPNDNFISVNQRLWEQKKDYKISGMKVSMV
jgi:hypothetical protein